MLACAKARLAPEKLREYPIIQVRYPGSSKICVGAPEHAAVGYSTDREQKMTELAAFNEQLDFLMKKKNKSCLSPECERRPPAFSSGLN